MATKFFMRYPEKEGFNQYWFSENTISVLVDEICGLYSENSQKIACISTPSLYFSLPEEIRRSSKVFDIDTGFSRDPGYVCYDFNHLETIPQDLYHYFDVIVIDPPFITREVWEKYSETVKLIGSKHTKIILSSISENAAMLEELLQVRPCVFKPSIPHLVYQYNFFTNYESRMLSQKNPEICED